MPRKWQEEALSIWRQNYRGIVRVVTGGGKTAFAEMCMVAFRERFPDGRFVILVPTTALLDQWYVSLREDLAVPEQHISCFSGEEKSGSPNIVNLIVLNTARQMAPTLAQSRSCLIVDECHRAGSPVNAHALQGAYDGALGLSATPERDYDAGFEEHLVPSLGNVVYSYDYSEAAADNVISPFDLVNVRVELLEREQLRYDALSRSAAKELRKLQAGEGSNDRIKRILQQRASVSSSAAMRVPTAAKLADMHKGQRTLIFHERIEKADVLYRVLAQRNLNVTRYHTGIGPIVRRDNLRLYRQGIFEILITCRALDEGLNVPETTVAIIASSTASTRQRIQRLGRVLRPAPGKEASTVYTIYATSVEERRLLEEEKALSGITSVQWLRVSR